MPNIQKNGTGKWKWLIGPALTLLLILGGFSVQWATTRAAVQEIQKDQTKLEKNVDDIELRVRGVELGNATITSVLERLVLDIQEIKQDVKSLLTEEE